MEKTVARRGFIRGGLAAALAGVGCAVIGEASHATGMSLPKGALADWQVNSCQPTCDPVKPEPMALEREWSPTAEHWAHAIIVAVPLEEAIGYIQDYESGKLVPIQDHMLYIRQRFQQYAIPFEAVVLSDQIDHYTAQAVITVSHPSFPERKPGTHLVSRGPWFLEEEGNPGCMTDRQLAVRSGILGIAVE